MHRLALDLRFRSFALTKSEIGMCARLQFCAGMLSLETFNRSPRSVGASVPLMAFGDGEALEQTLDADGRTEYRVKPRKTKAIESDTQLNVAASRLVMVVRLAAPWLADQVSAFLVALRTVDVVIANPNHVDSFAPAIASVVNDNLFLIHAQATSAATAKLRYGTDSPFWPVGALDVDSDYNQRLVRHTMELPFVMRAPRNIPQDPAGGSGLDFGTTLFDAHGKELCIAHVRGLCRGAVCPKGRSHEPMSAAQKEQFQVGFVKRRAGRPQRAAAHQG